MYRVMKLSIFVLLVYATLTASTIQQAAMLQGILALKDAVFAACERDDSPCTEAIASAKAVLASYGWLGYAQPAPARDAGILGDGKTYSDAGVGSPNTGRTMVRAVE